MRPIIPSDRGEETALEHSGKCADANRRFRPSYTLCPTKSDSHGLFDSQRIEIGEDTGVVDVTKVDGGKMVMSDVPVPPRAAMKF